MLRSILLLLLAITCCDGVAPLSEQSRRIAIDMHNKFRSIVAQGGAKSRGVLSLPTAAKMRKLTYSMELEQRANQNAGHCDISIHTTGQNYVENYAVYSVKIANITQERAMEEGVKKWFSELLHVGVNGILFTKGTSFGVRHFTQMVWENLEEIGCSVNFCGDIRGSALNGRYRTRALVVCMYRPKGNKYGTPIYEAGSVCSKCSDMNGRCDTTTQLCAV